MSAFVAKPIGAERQLYTHHASADDPQYEIKSDKTDHIAMHKGGALTKMAKPAPRK